MASKTAVGRWTFRAVQILEDLIEREADHIEQVSQFAADAIGNGGVVHMFGTGHSRMAVEEMFPRYGSYPGFHPLVELSMTNHTQVTGANGQRQAMFIERVEGFAKVILSNFHLRPTDVMVVISHGGVTAVPVEISMVAQAAGMPVVALTSVAHSMATAPGHSSGTRLLDHADVVIDLGTPVGDSLIMLEGLETPVGPGSTMSAVAVVNEVKVRTAELLVARGHIPKVLTSGAIVGAERSAELFTAAYAEHGRLLAALIG